MTTDELHDLLLQALETEFAGAHLYAAALARTTHDDRTGEWERLHRVAQRNVEIVGDLMRELDLDPTTETPARARVRTVGERLVRTVGRTVTTPHCAHAARVGRSTSC